MDAGRIEVSLPQDKIDSINNICQSELEYWKEEALERALDQNDTNQLEDLTPPSLFLTRGATKNVKNAKKMDIDEIIFYLLESKYFGDEDEVVFTQNFPSVEEVPYFEGIQEELKIILKYIKDGENMSLRNKALFGG